MLTKYGYNEKEHWITIAEAIDKDGFYKKVDVDGNDNGNGGNSGSFNQDDVPEGTVLFIDYNGTIVEAYTGEEIQALSALPANPEHDGLISQGWNWELDRIKYYMEKYPKCVLTVGQMYNTADRATHMYLELTNNLDIELAYEQSAANSVHIDWGDGSPIETSSSSDKVIMTHAYSSEGEYDLKIQADDGETVRLGYSETSGSNSTTINKTIFNDKDQYDHIYYIVKKIHFADNVILNDGSFSGCCRSLEVLTLPKGIEGIGVGVFSDTVFSLESVIIPNTITQIPNNLFSFCIRIKLLSIPEEIVSIGLLAFSSCYSLKYLTLPEGISINSGAFSACEALKSLTLTENTDDIASAAFAGGQCIESLELPDEITSIDENGFASYVKLRSVKLPSNLTTIGNSGFVNCNSLKLLDLPEDITSIGTRAFAACYCLLTMYVRATTPPTISSNTFDALPSNTIIYVPASSVDAYKIASVWNNYADQIEAIPEE